MRHGREWAENAFEEVLGRTRYAHMVKHCGYITIKDCEVVRARPLASAPWPVNEPPVDLYEVTVRRASRFYRMYLLVLDGHGYIYEPGGRLCEHDYYAVLGVDRTVDKAGLALCYIKGVDLRMSASAREMQHEAFTTLTQPGLLLDYYFRYRITSDSRLQQNLVAFLRERYSMPMQLHMLGTGVGPDQLYIRHVDMATRAPCDGLPEVFSLMFLKQLLNQPVTAKTLMAGGDFLNIQEATVPDKRILMKKLLLWFSDTHRECSSQNQIDVEAYSTMLRIRYGEKLPLNRGPFTEEQIRRCFYLEHSKPAVPEAPRQKQAEAKKPVAAKLVECDL